MGGRLRDLLAPAFRPMLAAGLVAVLATLASAAVVVLIGSALGRGSVAPLWWALGFLVVRAVLDGLSPALRATAAGRVRRAGQETVYRHLVALGPAVFDVRRPGELVSLAGDAVARVAALAGTFVPLGVRAALVPPAVAALALGIDLPSGLVMLVLFPLTPWVLRRLERDFRQAGDTLRRSQETLTAEFLEAIQGLESLLLAGAAERWEERLALHAERVRADTMDVLAVAQRGLIGVDLVFSLLSVVGVGALVAWRAAVGAISGGEAFSLVLLAVVSTLALVDLVSFFYVGGLGLAGARRLAEFLALEPAAVRERGGKHHPPPGDLGVAVEDVWYHYPGADTPALAGLSLEVPPGTSVALVGRSGGGKSTLAALLLGTRLPDAGRVRLGTLDLREADRAWLSGVVGYVGQETHVFADTVAANLRLARPDATRAQMEEACRRARILDAVRRLPAGLDSVLGEGGADLSGGEVQRLGIARAFLADPPVLVMDEATSGLDLETEALLQRSMEELMAGRTTIVIAHRITTARRCDRVVQLEAGRVVAEGTPAEMGEGFYARMGAGPT